MTDWDEVNRIRDQIKKIDPQDKKGMDSLVYHCAALGGEPKFERGKASCIMTEHEPLETYTGLFLSATSPLEEGEAAYFLDFHGLDKSDFSECFRPGQATAKAVLQGIAICDRCFADILYKKKKGAWEAFVKEKEKERQ